MDVSSTISGFRGFLGARTATANVVGISGGIGLLGPALPVVGQYLQAPEGENWFTGLIRKVSQTVGLISMFCPALILPAAGLSLICAGISFYSGNYMGGALELLGAIPIVTAFRNVRLLQFKGMKQVALGEAEMAKYGVKSLSQPDALARMAGNTARAEKELKAAGEIVKKAGDKVEKAAETMSRKIDTLSTDKVTKDLFAKHPIPKGKNLIEQSKHINKTLKTAITEAKSVQKLAQDAHKAAEEAVKTAGKAASESQKTLLKETTKALKDADKRVKELEGARHSFGKTVRSWRHSREELRYSLLREDGFRRIHETSAKIEKEAIELVSQRGITFPNTQAAREADLVARYNKDALQTITTSRSQQLETLVDKAYGPVAGNQMKSIIAGYKEKGIGGAFEELVRSTRSSMSGFWARTNPKAIPTTPVSTSPVPVVTLPVPRYIPQSPVGLAYRPAPVPAPAIPAPVSLAAA